MKKTLSPDQIRDAVLGHLSTINAAGVSHVALPSRKGLTAEKRKTRQAVSTKAGKESVQKQHQATAGVKRIKEEALDVSRQSAPEPKIEAYRNPEIVPATGEHMEKISDLPALQEFIGECVRCKLCKARKTVVFGDGNPKARLMFVGEGPGADEDEQGIPFVGRAGQLLNKMIEAMGLAREDIYIANIVKCRPPENRAPEPDEIETCIPFLMKQIEIVAPEYIVCLGKTAAQALLNTQIPISKIRGKFQEINGIAVMPTYHPAFLLRSPPMKKFAWEDLQQVMKKMGLKGKGTE